MKLEWHSSCRPKTECFFNTNSPQFGKRLHNRTQMQLQIRNREGEITRFCQYIVQQFLEIFGIEMPIRRLEDLSNECSQNRRRLLFIFVLSITKKIEDHLVICSTTEDLLQQIRRDGAFPCPRLAIQPKTRGVLRGSRS